ncbi:MAG: hypothetical protein WA624_05005, partial [Methylocella sp.]
MAQRSPRPGDYSRKDHVSLRFANGTLLPWPWIDPNKALPWVEERIGLALAESQVAAIRLA